MDSSSSLARAPEKSRMEKFVRRVIRPAIVGRDCPICLRSLEPRGAAVLTVCSHAYCLECIRKWSNLKRTCPLCNSTFDSWFYNFDLSSPKLRKHQLPSLSLPKPITPRRRSSFHNIRQRVEEGYNGRRRRLPKRRTFGRPGSVPPHVIAQRKLQWRASVYNRRLQAVPIFVDDPVISQQRPRNDREKQRLLERIEPWIRRELEAVLGDSDPTIIVHVVTSLFFSRHEGGSVEDGFLAPLHHFLGDRTNMFWHELRCFADSEFFMEVYDELVEYRRLQ